MSKTENIIIFGKEYRLACPDDERDILHASATLLNDEMDKIRASGKVVGLDRIAVLAALNIASDVIKLSQVDTQQQDSDSQKVQKISERVAVFLDEEK